MTDDQDRRDGSKSDSSSFGPTAPALTVPKGGGAIRGIGEKFAANPVTGTASMTFPIPTSPGRSGFGPDLTLSYDSGHGNGPFGFGWSLSVPSITRKTDKGLPLYRDDEESDVFILSGAEDLVPVLLSDGRRFEDASTAASYTIHRYRPRIEGLFARIERWTHQRSGEIHWRSISRENVTSIYGKSRESRVSDPADPSEGHRRVFAWLLCQSYDDKGNAILYEYLPEDDRGVAHEQTNERNRIRTANRYLKRIRYGNQTPNRDAEWNATDPALLDDWLFEVIFDYDEGHYEDLDLDPSRREEEQHRFARAWPAPRRRWSVRPDAFSSHRSGFEIRTYRRCHRVLMFHRFAELGDEPCLVRSTDFDYSDLDYSKPVAIEAELAHQGSTRFASFICRMTQSGFVRDAGATPPRYLKKSYPPVEIEYSKAEIHDVIKQLDRDSVENLPAGFFGAHYRWVDLEGEGVSGILSEEASAWFYKPNLGDGRFGPMEPVGLTPSLAALNGGRQQLLDLSGDGQLDLVAFSGPAPGFFERTEDRTWEPFRIFKHLPNISWSDSNLRFIDLDGDGHADILITEQDVFTWYPSMAEEGFGPPRRIYIPSDEERGPRLVAADGTQSIYLADMSGDGLTDVVRVRNGEICYWPNVGHGGFGAKVTMDKAPHFDNPEQFDERRIRLADIDGSGTTDIIYLGRSGMRLYFNQSGNQWSDAHPLGAFPPVDNLSSVMTADLFGNGTTCLVWSSPLPGDARGPLRYIDLMSGQKPHLLIGTRNNLGAETRIHYASSTKFYLIDKVAGRPWITRIPFPVHVVERVETYDRISRNRFVTRHSYHHGYFDGVEREFRGFGMVEQTDTEHLATLGESEIFPAGENIDAASHVPPALTRTWYHTGVHAGRAHVSDFFAGLLNDEDPGEYYREPGLSDDEALELLLNDTELSAGLTFDEEREACRALKGSMLRQEVYALDGTEKESHPYTVTEQNFGIRLLQPRGTNLHAVFITHPLETIVYHYQRTISPPDPRTSHSLNLDVDDFGNVLASAAIGYGRRIPDSSLPVQNDRRKQATTFITLADNRFTTAIDEPQCHRTPLSSEELTYELTGAELPRGRRSFTIDEIRALRSTAAIINYEDSPKSGLLQKRLITHRRILYRRDDLSGPLSLGAMQSLALPFSEQKLALTRGLVSAIFGQGRVSDLMLEEEGRFFHSEEDDDWWIPSARVFYSLGSADVPSQELAFARGHFFLPHRYRDPFHTEAVPTESFVSYDRYNYLVQETRDAIGNRITAGERAADSSAALTRSGLDYRVLQPALVMDPNRNRTEVAFDALGMIAGTAVMGKPEEDPIVGDRLSPNFHADLTQAEIDEFFGNPKGPSAASLLNEASTRLVYDITAYSRDQKSPAFVASLAREIHIGQPAPEEGVRIQVGFSYSDGFGREIEKKIEAELGPVPRRDRSGQIVVGPDNQPVIALEEAALRWVGSGWTIFNNKGNPVRQFEPFITDTHRFELDVRIGVSPTLFYDPVGRVVATLHPNHTWEKLVFDSWHQQTWDEVDTLLLTDPRTDADVGAHFRRLPSADYLPSWYEQRRDGALGREEQAAARKAAVHAATPMVSHADSLGRTFLTIARNRVKYSDAPPEERPVDDLQSTRFLLDVEGNQREVIDANGRVIIRHDYDLLGTRIHQISMEAGERWTLNDVAGKPLFAWDSRDHRFRTVYDALRRPTDFHLIDGSNREALVSRMVYGEARPNPEAKNLRGKLVELFDQAGVVTTDEYDFKGNLLRSRRQLAQSYNATIDWSDPAALEPETFTNRTRYDALNRPIQVVVPHSDRTGARFNVLQPAYNEANLLERVSAWLDQESEPDTLLQAGTATMQAVAGIDYDAKARRIRIETGNGVTTHYTYDPLTFRLTRIHSLRGEESIQDLGYTYDPIGNVTHVRDRSRPIVYYRNRQVDPSADYTYDALYRLIEATGREHLGQVGAPLAPSSWDDAPRFGIEWSASDGKAMGPYLERYVYDAAGNLLSMQHRRSDPASPGWMRTFVYDEPSVLEPDRRNNRLTRTATGGFPEQCSSGGNGYDAHGNMTRMSHLQILRWDYKDQLQMTQRQVVNAVEAGEPERHGERTWHVYDSAGQRVRKITEDSSGRIKSDRIYLGGFEVHRVHGTDPLLRETLHVMDGKQRLVLVERRTEGREPGVPAQRIRYQFTNHLGSTTLELDEEANIISYEEYTPFGSTSFEATARQAEVPKRFRFIGKERDEESGLYYHGARYYAPWLARWTSCDPAGMVDGVNLYSYARDNPVRYADQTGKQCDPSSQSCVDPSEPTAREAAENRSIPEEHTPVADNSASFTETTCSADPDLESGGAFNGSDLVGAGRGLMFSASEGFTLIVPDSYDATKMFAYREGVLYSEIGKNAGPGHSTELRRNSAAQVEAREMFGEMFPAPTDQASGGRGWAKDHIIELQHDLTGERGTSPFDYRWQDSALNSREGSQSWALQRNNPLGVPAGGVARVDTAGRWYNSEGYRAGVRGLGEGMMVVGAIQTADHLANAIEADVRDGTGGRQTARAAATETGGWVAAGYGAETGAELGLSCGEAAPICSPVGALILGGVGYHYGSEGVNQAINVVPTPEDVNRFSGWLDWNIWNLYGLGAYR
jgi:RHS repeat-associated protein